VLFFSSTRYEYDGDDDNNIEIAIDNANENENGNDLGFNLLLINNNNNASDDPGGDDTTMNTTTYPYFYYVYFIILFLPHFFLQISGFGFSIPKIRHPDGNRIWPQYRYEALVFFCRCMSLLLLAWHRKIQNWGYQHHKHDEHEQENEQQKGYRQLSPLFWNSIIVFATMIAADNVAKKFRQGKQQPKQGSKEQEGTNIGTRSRTIRDLKGPPSILYLMSAAQFHATLNSLLTNDRLSVQIVALSVVQLSAFGMTLRRKSIISQKMGVGLYSILLLLGMIVIIHDYHLIGNDNGNIFYLAISLGNIAALLRFELHLNKYILWTFMIFMIHYVLVEDGKNGYWVSSSSWMSSGMTTTTNHKQIYHSDEWFYVSIGSTFALLLGSAKCHYLHSDLDLDHVTRKKKVK
jgi:hypothetical protein